MKERRRRPEKIWWFGLFAQTRRRDMPPRYQGRRAKELLRFPVRSLGATARRLLEDEERPETRQYWGRGFIEYLMKIRNHKSRWLRPDAVWMEGGKVSTLVVACSVCGDGNDGRYHYLLERSTCDRLEELLHTMQPDGRVGIALLDFYGSGICTRVEANKEELGVLVQLLGAKLSERQPTEWKNVRIRMSPFSHGEGKRDKVEKAIALLEPLLADGPIAKKVIDQKADAAGIKNWAVEEAGNLLGVDKNSRGRHGCLWIPPGHPGHPKSNFRKSKANDEA